MILYLKLTFLFHTFLNINSDFNILSILEYDNFKELIKLIP
jgi:hypothetical protein